MAPNDVINVLPCVVPKCSANDRVIRFSSIKSRKKTKELGGERRNEFKKREREGRRYNKITASSKVQIFWPPFGARYCSSLRFNLSIFELLACVKVENAHELKVGEDGGRKGELPLRSIAASVKEKRKTRGVDHAIKTLLGGQASRQNKSDIKQRLRLADIGLSVNKQEKGKECQQWRWRDREEGKARDREKGRA